MRQILLIASCCLLFICLNAIPCSANILPESGMAIHVQPVTGSCETSITACDEVVPWTYETGPLEFLIFFQPTAWQPWDQPLCILELYSYVEWPESWELIEFDPCGAPNWTFIDGTIWMSWFPGGAPLTTEWEGVSLVARLVLNADGPGWVRVADSEVWMGRVYDEYCLDFAGTYPSGMSAEVGVDCEYEGNGCPWIDWCELNFAEPELYLSAPHGGVAHGRMTFGTDHCDALTVDTRADWATAEIEPIGYYESVLLVTADATALPPGTYETWIQVANELFQARCLHVIFNVSESSSVPDSDETPPPALETTWGRLKTIYR